MRILMLNWKDTKHPFAGGAEYVTHQYAKHLSKRNHQITIFTSSVPPLPQKEIIQGVTIIRQGSSLTVYLYAYFFYQKYKDSFDVIIDQIHGIPFFTPLYVSQPVLFFIHELAGPIWFMEFPFPLSFLGWMIERFYLTLYKKIHFLTVSISTARDLKKHGIQSSYIHIINNAAERNSIEKILKSKNPTLCYIGRLSPVKRIDLFLYAIALLKKHLPSLQVYIIGKGKPAYQKYIAHLTQKLALDPIVIFKGTVSENEKFRLLQKSWLNVQSSFKEGFGLTVLEAAQSSTPTICFDVPGLKDVVIHNKTGIIVREQTSGAQASEILKLVKNKKKLLLLSKNAYHWSKKLPEWEDQTVLLEQLLYKFLIDQK